MSELFLKIVNMSISASWVVIAVLTLRFCLKKAPKWVNVLLWGIVAARMVFPFSIESVLSLIPSAETISPTVGADTFRPDGCSCPQSCYQPSNQQLVHARTGRKCKSAANMDSGFNGDMAFRNSSPFPLLCCELLAFAPQGLRSGNLAGQHLSKREGLLSVCAGNHQTQNLSSVSYGQPRDGSCDCP